MLGIFNGPSSYKYHIERVGPDGIEGWVHHRRHRKPCRVEIRTTDRELLASGVASIGRADLGGRTCGFKLEVDTRKLMALVPRRFLLFVDGIKVSNTYFFATLEQGLLEQELIERHETLNGLQTERLERENEYLTRRVAELERKIGQQE